MNEKNKIKGQEVTGLDFVIEPLSDAELDLVSGGAATSACDTGSSFSGPSAGCCNGTATETL